MSFEIKTERVSVENESKCEAISGKDSVDVQYVTTCERLRPCGNNFHQTEIRNTD
jgi:hypothetical protein